MLAAVPRLDAGEQFSCNLSGFGRARAVVFAPQQQVEPVDLEKQDPIITCKDDLPRDQKSYGTDTLRPGSSRSSSACGTEGIDCLEKSSADPAS